MKLNRAPIATRSPTTRVVERPRSPEAQGPLRFDSTDDEVHSSTPISAGARGLAGVKRAILRWLEKEL
jgi:hypothetical protein